MAVIASFAATMSAPDRKGACLARARACRERADSDPANHDYWVNESIKWLERAVAPVGHVVITVDKPVTVNVEGQDRAAAAE